MDARVIPNGVNAEYLFRSEVGIWNMMDSGWVTGKTHDSFAVEKRESIRPPGEALTRDKPTRDLLVGACPSLSDKRAVGP